MTDDNGGLGAIPADGSGSWVRLQRMAAADWV